jgi:hypothetical protein
LAELQTLSPGDLEVRIRAAVADAEAAAFTPVPGGAFTHLTTQIETTIPTTLVLSVTTAVTSGALIIATTKLEQRVNDLLLLFNRVVYTLQSNGLTS